MEWDESLLLDEDLTKVNLSRGFSEAIATFVSSPEGELDEDLDAVFKEFDGGVEIPPSPAELSSASEADENPTTLCYSSDDNSSFDANSVQHSSSDSDMQGTQKKKTSRPRKKNNPGLTAAEKREQRKLRNRELAAESRKRKNDEMERLKKENAELKQKIAELLKKFGNNSPTSVAESHALTETKGPAPMVKRSRIGTAVSTSVAVASLAVFVLTGPLENNGLTSTASVLLTTLDSCEGHVAVNPSIGQFLFTLALAVMIVCIFAGFAVRLIHASLSSFPFKLASSVDCLGLPKRMNSFGFSNSV